MIQVQNEYLEECEKEQQKRRAVTEDGYYTFLELIVKQMMNFW